MPVFPTSWSVGNASTAPPKKSTKNISYQDSISNSLGQLQIAKENSHGIVETYVLNTENSKLDGSLHPALDTTNPYIKLDTEAHRWVDVGHEDPVGDDIDLEKYYKDVHTEEQQFIRAMKDYEATAEEKYKTGINIEETHTMDQIWETMDVLVQKYQVEDVKGFWGSVRKAFRKLGEHEKAISGWLGLMPKESHYLSVVCGGFKLILDAAARLKKLRDDIFEALEEIPTVLSSAQRVLAIHRGSDRIREFSSALYVSILHSLAHIIDYLRYKASRKVLKVGLKQSSFELVLSDKLKTMQRCRDLFNREATVCSQERLKKVEQVGDSTNKVAKGVYQEVLDVKQMQQIMHWEQCRTQKEITDRMKTTERELRATIEALGQVMDLFHSSPQVNEVAFMQLMAVPNMDPRSRSSSPAANAKSTGLSLREARRLILTRLSYDKAAIRDDVVTNVMLAMILPLENQDRAVHVIKSAAMATWSNAVHSGLLLVNGNSSRVDRRSPLTFVCAKLADSLHRSQSNPNSGRAGGAPRIYAVHFFCGEHLDGTDPNNTACGITNSLLAQLLKECSKHVDSLATLIALGDFESGDISAVFNRLELLIQLLPREAIVFCIVDGLSYYLDDENQEEDANTLVRRLVKLTRKRGKKRCVVKLLLTAANRLNARSTTDGNLMDGEVLEVPRNLPKGGGFTDIKWEMSVGQHIAGMVQ